MGLQGWYGEHNYVFRAAPDAIGMTLYRLGLRDRTEDVFRAHTNTVFRAAPDTIGMSLYRLKLGDRAVTICVLRAHTYMYISIQGCLRYYWDVPVCIG